ncbi:BglG family transcription antiterminator [Fervidibacillus halotolerans]|uniref:Ascorbate-specific PTS system EIIA component n=1 Tax=Fervidibacillus halotolerans TaxID=2980027 RepID=A0A9E8RXE4_9BACI|nr:BglG family transcription antiterminator [Fervidibacillus halotolerans]WAA12690.1 BglG family transcription antiterminator [Fervidibacillus halotolerans]
MILLDDRSLQILKELLVSKYTKVNDLEKKFNLTRRQVNYTIEKINDWLTDNHLPKIKNKRNIGLIIDSSVLEEFPELLEMQSSFSYFPTKKERKNLILLMILTSKEDLSLFHFSSTFKISKNTVLHDLEKLKQFLLQRNLQLQYSRREGYFIEGEELAQRKLIVDIINKILQMSEGLKWIRTITGITEDELNKTEQMLDIIEKRLNKQFTDQRHQALAIILLILKRRMNEGKHPGPFPISYRDISNTKEYEVVEDVFGRDENLNDQEKLYIAMHILSSSVVTTEMDHEAFREKLYSAIERFVTNFEKVACVNFQNKQLLYQKLYQHLKPAFYRVTYELSLENPLLNLIKQEYGDIHLLVKQNIDPLETLFSAPIPEDELSYLTLLIKSALSQQGDDQLKKPRAIVVCPSGISVSRLLFEELREMFPEFIFLDHISVRQFATFEADYDIVFSTVFLNTEKKLFLIPSVFTDQKKQNLKIEVEQEFKQTTPTFINYDKLIHIIEKHADIKRESSLKEDLKSFFYYTQFSNANHGEDYKPNLSELISFDYIQLNEDAKDWKEAILLASQPLLENAIIENNYVDAMINVIQEYGTYLIVPKVVVPHARPEEGAFKLNISLLTLNQAIRFPKNNEIQILIVISIVDKKSHIKALTQLYDLLTEKNNIDAIISAKNPVEIMKLFQKYSVN